MAFFNWLKQLFSSNEKPEISDPMKYLIAGLGNIGSEYQQTRHNIGFEVLDFLASQHQMQFRSDNLASVGEIKYKGRTFVLIKPTTYMNLSGKAVKYWMQKLKIPQENILVVLDDLNLDFGSIRLRLKGSDGGHNGLKNIDQMLGNNEYPRLRIGIGSGFRQGQQVNFVLGKWNKNEAKDLDLILEKSAEAILNFGTIGPKLTMEASNKKIL